MPDDKDAKPSFWTTLPGVMTALGALMAASAGLLTALYTTGMIGSRSKPPDNLPLVSSPTAESPPNNTNKREQTTPDEASRDFMLGRWEAEQTSGNISAGTVVDYEEDGTFTGWTTTYVGGFGQREQTSGQWDFQKLSKDKFRLRLRFDNMSTITGTFRIIDQNHVHNIDQNYIAVRK